MDNERKGLWLGGQPYWLAIICCLLCLIPMYIPKGEGMVQTTDMTGTLAICFGLAVILNEVGERIPIWNTYIGGGLLLTFFGVAILRQFELIRQAGSVPILYGTWARKAEPEAQAQMNEAHRRIAEEIGALLAPVGERWWDWIKAHPNAEMYDPDGAHASAAGSEFAAAQIWETIRGDGR